MRVMVPVHSEIRKLLNIKNSKIIFSNPYEIAADIVNYVVPE